VLLEAGISGIPAFKEAFRKFALVHALEFQDHSKETAANRQAMRIEQSFQTKSLTYDPRLTVAASASAPDSDFVILATNSGLPGGVVSLAFVYDSSNRNERSLVERGVASFSANWKVLPAKN
jgi:hypothetical protein